MLVWICLGAFILCVVGVQKSVEFDFLFFAGFLLFGITLLLMLPFVAINNATAQGEFEKLETTYESLSFQYENNYYNTYNEIGKKELMSEIQEYNGKIAWGKSMQQNFWIGPFIPNIYDELELIALERVEEE